MKGGEGCFLVILFITICISDVYVSRVKGDVLFSFRISNFQFLRFYLYLCYVILSFICFVCNTNKNEISDEENPEQNCEIKIMLQH